MTKHIYHPGAKETIERLVRAFEDKREAERRCLPTPFGRVWINAATRSGKRSCKLTVRDVRRLSHLPFDAVDLIVHDPSGRQSGEA